MSDERKYRKHSSKSSRRHKEDLKKSKSRKTSYQNASKHSRGSETPPLPKRSHEIEDLLKKRHSLKQELEKLEQYDKKVSKSRHSLKETRKRGHSDTQSNSKNYKPQTDKKVPKETKKRELSPDYKDIHLDSEDEEYIIEQRRKQRKQLLEKLNGSEKSENKPSESISPIELKETSNDNVESDSKASIAHTNTKSNTGSDMFSEKDDFVPNNTTGTLQTKDVNNSQLTDNWDDAEGYYRIRVGDVINKYNIKDMLGQGVFANVVRVLENNTNQVFAIKIVRNNDLMYKTSLKEISILKEIKEADPDNKYHCVKFFGHFMHKGHLCILFESLHMDLRAVLKKYGKNDGINMKALRSYSRQLFLSLRLLRKISIIHADIKPDNILINEKKNILKLCDFGSASKLDENEATPYLVSRFYRAPEIILGVTYNHGIDVWSTACTIYEMATGKILFTGNTNNSMLKCFMDLKGRISSKLIKKGKFKDQHFNYNNTFLLHKKDEFSGREKVVEVLNTNPVRDLYKELQKSFKDVSAGEEKKLTQLKDLLEKMLILDPNQRATVSDCLRHPFILEELEN